MFLTKLEITGFRNIESLQVEFSKDINFIFGDNAQGKTNLIESIYIICIAKSFRTRDDSELVPFGKDMYLLSASFMTDSQTVTRVGVTFQLSQGKQVKIDGKRLDRYSKLIGRFPIVVLSSDDFLITDGPPAERRKYFNIVISQCSGSYLECLKEYEKSLRQRNKILSLIASGQRFSQTELEIWDSQLIKSAEPVMVYRSNFIRELCTYLVKYYKIISDSDKDFKIEYRPNVKFTNRDDLFSNFSRQLQRVSVKERKRGITLVGPHRDEFVLKLGNRDIRKYGSRGERKSALVSLKAAETDILKEKTAIEPILLLDDLYAELDKIRGRSVLDVFKSGGQTFITGTSLDYEGIKKMRETMTHGQFFNLHNGQLTRV